MEKTIKWGASSFDTKKMQEATHRVTSINVNNQSNMVSIIIQRGLGVDSVQMSMEHAQEIGFINFNALINYCK